MAAIAKTVEPNRQQIFDFRGKGTVAYSITEYTATGATDLLAIPVIKGTAGTQGAAEGVAVMCIGGSTAPPTWTSAAVNATDLATPVTVAGQTAGATYVVVALHTGHVNYNAG